MYNQALGCKTTGCFVGAIIVLGFFAYLLQSAQEMADQFKATHAAPVQPSQRTKPTDPPREEEAAEAGIINAMRLPVLLTAIKRYATDHQDTLPPMETPDTLQAALVPKYVPEKGVFESPSAGQLYLTNPVISGKPLKSIARPAETMVLYEPLETAGTDGKKRRAVLFLDGHQSQVTPAEWDVLRGAAVMP